MSCCRDRELAEDVLPSVYVRLLGDHAPHERGSSLRTWLFAVIRNAARDHQRKRWWSRVLRLEFDSLAQMKELLSAKDHGKAQPAEVRPADVVPLSDENDACKARVPDAIK